MSINRVTSLIPRAARVWRQAFGGHGGLGARMIRGGSANAVIQAGNKLATLLTGVVFARLLGADGYGVYAQAMALAALLQSVVEFGAPSLLVRELAAARARADTARLTVCLVLAFGLVVATGSLTVALAATSMTMGLGQEGSETQTAFTLALGLVVVVALARTATMGMWALGKVVLGNAIYLLLRPAGVLAITGALLLAGAAVTPVSAVAAQLSAGVGILLVAAWALWRNLPARTQVGRGSYDAAAWLKSAGPLAVTAAAVTVTTQTDVLMLGYFEPDDQVGLYRVASQGALLVTFGLQAVDAILAPEFTRLHAGGDSVRLQKLATFSARVVVLVALPIAVAFIAAGDLLAALVFGSDFAESHAPLAVLAVGQLVNAAFGSVGMLMNMTRHERDSARAVAVAAVLNVVLNACLIPPFGVMGAAIATAVSVATWNVILYRGALVRLGIDSSAIGPRKP